MVLGIVLHILLGSSDTIMVVVVMVEVVLVFGIVLDILPGIYEAMIVVVVIVVVVFCSGGVIGTRYCITYFARKL